MLHRAKAPLRVSFAGGGTDVPPFPELEGGLVLNATINKYAFGTLAPRTDDQVTIELADFDLAVSYDQYQPMVLDGKLDLVKAAIEKVEGRGSGGFDLSSTRARRPQYRNLPLTGYEIADLAYTIERGDLGIKGDTGTSMPRRSGGSTTSSSSAIA